MDLNIIEKTLFLEIGELSPVNLNELCEHLHLPSTSEDEIDYQSDYNLLRDIDYKDDYDTYEKITNHIGFSEDLHILNEKGHYLISQLKEKADPVTHEFSDSIVENVYNSVKISIKARNVGTGTLFNELMCLLDELLFSDVEDDMEFFVLNDTEYKLTSIYYGQDEWMEKYTLQQFEFSKTPSLEEGEIMILMCYINDYTAFIDRIHDHMELFSTSFKLSKITSKILIRLDKVKDQLSSLLTTYLST